MRHEQQMPRRLASVCVFGLIVLAGLGCDGPLELDFEPPELPRQAVLGGITFRASSSVVGENPTTVRVVVEIRNETNLLQRVSLRAGPCMVLVNAYWARNPEGQLVAPPSPERGICFAIPSGHNFWLDPGESELLPFSHDVAPSQVLGSAFEPGSYLFGAVVDELDPEPYAPPIRQVELDAGRARIKS